MTEKYITLPDGTEMTIHASGFQTKIAPGDDEKVKADTREQFEALVVSMCFDDISDFEKCTGVTCDELLGKWFILVHDRIYIE